MTSQTTLDKAGQGDGPSAGPSEATPGKGLRGHPWFTLFTVAVGVMMVALDGTIVAIANPAIASDLGATLADVQWITNAYFLALAVSLITAGKLGDRFGHRQTFLIGVVGFAAASGAIGLSDSITLVIVFRVLQGLFGALLMPAALGLLRATFPAEKLNMAIGIWGMVIGASTAGGPILGGVLVEHVSWQSVFFINVPVGVLAVALGVWILLDHRAENAPRSFDIPGIALLSGAMFCLVWALIKAPEWGWGDGRTWAFIAASVVGFAVFAFWETKVREPLIPLALFRSVPLSAGVVLMVLMAIAFMGGLFFVTFYLQNVHGLSPVDAGLHLLPLTGMMIVGSPLAGVMITKVGPRIPLAGGMACTALAMYGISTLEKSTGSLTMSIWFALLGLGLAPVMVGATEVIVGNAPLELSGVAGGLQQSAMQVGGSLGTAVLGAVMASKVDGDLPGNWEKAGLPPLTPEQAGQASEAVQVGVPPVPKGTPEAIAAKITDVAHDTFISGMSLASLVAAGVAAVAVLVALLTKRGENAEAGAGVGHI
ncbi:MULTISPECIES: MFS transporter [Streptomyces]|jgi:EmrB/QacA subfamily drug resistance transporter|uniref:EmrB/QacA subfamily drug resistance transporter n=1 Tax=Streptomyces thermodiastaticus TaxID=44061 RepID=A0ABU0KDW3_9ACTN|nr:EmrB/QacA subfamily drug resistance transporter [Streptomyces thermodiastaticus]MXQ58751.1 DHA2 family efflux MFS transporter permease subunit [Streptomyces sp. XHT-2]MYQ30672.1 DHA2 family efflux MFS transporter permease subunit [Streptomyces sp. SID4956]THC50634.1 DHA2 family efflux MFS transporter permease subunit [Streptomyces sp. Akac8]UVT09568.1 MFS transporter [Streptomyces thermocarboxydus]WSB41237.1 MFS transporter [Streptomyces cellulosae]